jgi:hypothetical protein
MITFGTNQLQGVTNGPTNEQITHEILPPRMAWVHLSLSGALDEIYKKASSGHNHMPFGTVSRILLFWAGLQGLPSNAMRHPPFLIHPLQSCSEHPNESYRLKGGDRQVIEVLEWACHQTGCFLATAKLFHTRLKSDSHASMISYILHVPCELREIRPALKDILGNLQGVYQRILLDSCHSQKLPSTDPIHEGADVRFLYYIRLHTCQH